MTDRTLKIINLCKGWGKYIKNTPIETIVEYMSEECLCPKEAYTYQIIEDVMLEALYDYIDVCDKPSSVLRNIYKFYINQDDSTLVDRIWRVFSLAQVHEGCINPKFCNGFDERFEHVRKELY